MKYAVITFGRAGSSELIDKLTPKIDVIPKPDNHLYPDKLFKKYGSDIKVIFLTRTIKDIIRSVLQREEDKGIKRALSVTRNIEFYKYQIKFNLILINYYFIFLKFHKNAQKWHRPDLFLKKERKNLVG